MLRSLLSLLLLGSAAAFSPAFGSLAARRHTPAARMMFGGGDKKDGDGNFMDKLKAAKDMFNPEMMKKYSEVGVKVQQLQEELQQTEIECSTGEGKVVVKMSGTQTPVSVTVSDEVCSMGAEAAGAELTAALKQAHAKSGKYAQEQMATLYADMGLAGGMAPPS